MPYETDLTRIEAIVEELQRNDLELDRALQLFEEGIARIKSAHDALTAAEAQVKRLVEQADGTVTLVDIQG